MLLKTPLKWFIPILSPILKKIPGNEYFFKCINEGYGDFNGRARRSELWYYYLLYIIYYFIIMICVGVLIAIFSVLNLNNLGSIIVGILLFLAFVPFIVPSIAVAVRRLHDTGKSGWLFLIAFIPFGGLVLLIFYILDSTPGANQYGENPKGM